MIFHLGTLSTFSRVMDVQTRLHSTEETAGAASVETRSTANFWGRLMVKEKRAREIKRRTETWLSVRQQNTPEVPMWTLHFSFPSSQRIAPLTPEP